jgi:hypothetical protein
MRPPIGLTLNCHACNVGGIQPGRIETVIGLEIHICDQRRSYLARFSTEDQALAFAQARSDTHAIHELEDQAVPLHWTRLLEWLYPTCEHGLSQSNCYGPQHYYFDEEEQARGMRNGW